MLLSLITIVHSKRERDREREKECEKMETNSEMKDERQTCRQGQSQILLFTSSHLLAIDIAQRKRETE
ncbi:hypothetical protein HN51_009275 [Arachis hypogaea]